MAGDSKQQTFSIYISRLEHPGRPEKPYHVEVMARDDTSVGIMWTPGFDGGYEQRFYVQVFDYSTMKQVMRLKHVDNIEGNQTIVTGMKANTRYIIKVRAKNRDGYSDFADDRIFRTGGKKLQTRVGCELKQLVYSLHFRIGTCSNNWGEYDSSSHCWRHWGWN